MSIQSRRSCRVAMTVPIQVFGTDYRGIDFTEEACTLVVNLHGAKVRLTHQLLPEAEIRVVSHPTGQDAVFRVVSKLPDEELEFTYWGIENLEPQTNMWGVEIPELHSDDQPKVRVTLQCPGCSAQAVLHVTEALLVSLQEKGGADRTCGECSRSGLWQLPPCQAS